MAKRILVPLDGSSTAETLLEMVGDVARGGGATLRLLTVTAVPANLVSSEGRVVAYTDQEFDADLIAVSTAGRSGVGRAVLGSIAEQVFRKATAPVLLFRPSRSHA